MSSGIATIFSFLFIIGLAVVVDRYGSLDATTFIAGSALWWAIRAYYREPDVSTAHQTKNLED